MVEIGSGAERQKDCPDGPRYKVCGNSMVTPVIRWLWRRIQKVGSFIDNPYSKDFSSIYNQIYVVQ